MKPKENETRYLVRLVQSRFEWLKLTDEQAHAIHKYERNVESVPVEGNFPSFWEEKEIESHYFKEVLDSQQFAEYKKQIGRQIADAEEGLIQADKDALNEIKYVSKLLTYYKEERVPKLIEHRGKLGEREGTHLKLDYLKAEYQNYLRRQWKELCIGHFRNARDLQPNKFKEEQLRHEIEKVYPTYFCLKSKADEATRAVAKSMVSDLGYYMNKYQQFIDKENESMRLATDAIFEEFHPKHDRNGWHIIEMGSNRSEREKLEDGFLSYMLIDPERYE
jgi:hypothetical protein